MSDKIIFLNTKCGKKKSADKDSIYSKIESLKVKLDKMYNVEKKIEGIIEYSKSRYESVLAWSSLFLGILYLYYIAFLLNSHDSFLKVVLVLSGEYLIYLLYKKSFKLFKNIKLSKIGKNLEASDLNKLKSLLKEKEELKKSIKKSSLSFCKYIDIYIEDKLFREKFFYFIYKYVDEKNVYNLAKASEYAARQVKRLNFGLKTESI